MKELLLVLLLGLILPMLLLCAILFWVVWLFL